MISKWDEMVLIRGLCEVDVWFYFDSLFGDVILRGVFGSNFEEGKKIFKF